VSEHLEATVNVTLDGAGVGVVTTGPGRQGETWSVARYTTSGASAIDPRLDVFRGSAGLLDTTNHGNQDVVRDNRAGGVARRGLPFDALHRRARPAP